jgi:hypothetical protein
VRFGVECLGGEGAEVDEYVVAPEVDGDMLDELERLL